MALEPLGSNGSFGWHTQEVDGHDVREIRLSPIVLEEATKPSVYCSHCWVQEHVMTTILALQNSNSKELSDALSELEANKP